MFPQLTHVLLDAARMGEHMDTAKEFNKKHDSLYRGGKEQTLFAVAPYIFQFTCPSPFSDWYIDNGWGDSWGVLFKSSWPLPEMHKHFRKFLLVNTEDGQQLYFRFYDPRVLRLFLPTCEPQQLREFFGPIDYFLIEDDDPANALRYWHESGILKMQRLKTADIIKRHAPVDSDTSKAPENPVQMVAPSDMPAPRSQPVLQPVKPPPTQVPTSPKPETGDEGTSLKPKTKWNMFD